MTVRLIGRCPVCGDTANSGHHIRPRDEGGGDDHRNKVSLCSRCHDLVEEICQETGLQYSSALVRILQLKLGLPLKLYSPRRRVVPGTQRSAKPVRFSEAYTVCNRCGARFCRGKELDCVYCDECTALLTKGFIARSASSKRVREAWLQPVS